MHLLQYRQDFPIDILHFLLLFTIGKSLMIEQHYWNQHEFRVWVPRAVNWWAEFLSSWNSFASVRKEWCSVFYPHLATVSSPWKILLFICPISEVGRWKHPKLFCPEEIRTNCKWKLFLLSYPSQRVCLHHWWSMSVKTSLFQVLRWLLNSCWSALRSLAFRKG